MANKLAINGGMKIRREMFPQQNIPSDVTRAIVDDVLRSGILTGYQANHTNHYGGKWIKLLEREARDTFNATHAIAVNSCTSALWAALSAIGLRPGDQVIVTPYSMTCSATLPLLFGALPVFADVEHDTFCLDPDDVERKITAKTKAIIVVSLFGQPYDTRINDIAKKHKLYVIEDAAQAIWSLNKDGRATGTLADIGCFSFNHGKHISAGEGGMCLTNDDNLAAKIRGAMNHADSVNNSMCDADVAFMIPDKRQVGMNLRMTEITAAIVLQTMREFPEALTKRLNNVAMLQRELAKIPFLTPAPTREGCTHTYYVLPFLYDQIKANGVHRDKYLAAVRAELEPVIGRESEGVPIGGGYIKPIYRMPAIDMEWEVAPVCEKLWRDELVIVHRFFGAASTREDILDIIAAFKKVAENVGELK